MVLFLYYTFLINLKVNAEFNHKLIDAAIEEFIDIDTEYKDLVFNNNDYFEKAFKFFQKIYKYFKK